MPSSPEPFDPGAGYPVAEKRPDLVKTARGLGLDDVTVENVVDGRLDHTDMRITAEGLTLQAQVARAAGRDCLAENFARGAELVAVPDDVLLETYELLRPGRAQSAAELRERAAGLRRDYGAERIAAFLEEAAAVYDRRGLFRRRF